MIINYVVMSCSEDEIAVQAIVAGKEITAKVPGLVIELESEDGGMGHTFRLTPDDMENTKALFQIGNKIVATFAAGE